MRCKHGLEQAWCAECNPKKSNIRQPQTRITASIRGSKAPIFHNLKESIVRTSVPVSQRDEMFANLTPNTTFVHVDGFPFLWAVKRIIKQAPNVKIIQITPRNLRRLGPGATKICQHHKVEVVTGHWNPKLAWKDGELRSASYKGQRDFLLTLHGEQKDLFAELLEFNILPALMASRYFCLQDEAYIPYAQLLLEFGFVEGVADSYISSLVNSVFCYLDQEFSASVEAGKHARATQQKVVEIRKQIALAEQDTVRRDEIRKISHRPIPDGLPLRYYDKYHVLVVALLEGKLEELKKHNFPGRRKAYKLICLRYGIDDNKFRTLELVGAMLNITKSRAQQLEKSVFDKLEE